MPHLIGERGNAAMRIVGVGNRIARPGERAVNRVQQSAGVVSVCPRPRRSVRAVRHARRGRIRFFFLGQQTGRIGVVGRQARLHPLGRHIVGCVPGGRDRASQGGAVCIGLAGDMSPRVVDVLRDIAVVVGMARDIAVAVVGEAFSRRSGVGACRSGNAGDLSGARDQA